MTQIYVERALAIYRFYTMSARSGVIKAIASFCRVDTAFERHRSCIPINCDELETVQSLKKHLLSFLGLGELAIKFGEFDLKLKKKFHLSQFQGLADQYVPIFAWIRKVCS